MIIFDNSKFHTAQDGNLYLKYEDIEFLTEELISDYDPSLLSYPRAIEYDDFLEGYLDVNLLYQDIYTEDEENIILGCSVFNEQKVAIFDRERMRKNYVCCAPRTVIIDNSVVTGKRKIQENITGLHEGGHIWLHSNQFTPLQGQLNLGMKTDLICCRKSDIENSERLPLSHPSSAEMWRERQANVFAVTMGLPRKSLEISVNDLFHRYGIDRGVLIIDADSGSRQLAEQTIPEQLKQLYNMSKESIKYRLENTGYYKTRKKYEEEQAFHQMSIFDFFK